LAIHSKDREELLQVIAVSPRPIGPTQNIQRIADYRADDKADPTYYARLTVIKAQLSMMSRDSDGPARAAPGDGTSLPAAGFEPPGTISITRNHR
jgi:c-di-GMP-binding flagellar brake protein YcgR